MSFRINNCAGSYNYNLYRKKNTEITNQINSINNLLAGIPPNQNLQNIQLSYNAFPKSSPQSQQMSQIQIPQLLQPSSQKRLDIGDIYTRLTEIENKINTHEDIPKNLESIVLKKIEESDIKNSLQSQIFLLEKSLSTLLDKISNLQNNSAPDVTEFKENVIRIDETLKSLSDKINNSSPNNSENDFEEKLSSLQDSFSELSQKVDCSEKWEENQKNIDFINERISDIDDIIKSNPTDIPDSLLTRLTDIELKLKSSAIVKNTIDILNDKLKAIELKESSVKKLSDRLTLIEKSADTKAISDRLTTLENKKVKTEVSKALLERIDIIEKREFPDILPLNEKVASVLKKMDDATATKESLKELEKTISILSERLMTVEKEHSKTKLKINSLVEEDEYPSPHISPVSRSSSKSRSSLVKL